jgi:UDP-N-acetylglucosamine diphosphorylase / glucose-1-phosphate thymidylyltransferase / UDP-N-acetylgalactosamine diphosphorylase / glucosamine-1-phosphate N-acetyltransferase / galactosamine-1-phosphate N-acetyltransferase
MWDEELFEKTDFLHKKLLENMRYPWEVIKGISSYIKNWLKECNTEPTSDIDWGLLDKNEAQNGSMFVNKSVRLEKDHFLKMQGIFIGKGTLLEPTVFIKSPAIIGSNCEIRHGAYLRGNVIVGNDTVIGHATEVKNSVFMNHSKAGHFSYVGDSIVGNYVNLGAGVKLANLEFHNLEEKKNNIKKTIKYGEIIDTERNKLGAIIGDGGEVGCNSATSPGVILGKNCIVYPATNVRKGFYPPNSRIK